MSDFSQSSIITLALVSKWLAEQVGNSSVSAEARESLEVAHQCISEVLSSPSMPSADATIKSVAALNLETVVLEGLKALNGSKNQSEEKSVTEDESKGKFSPKFLQYMQKLETSGYFQGVEVNSVEYQSRVAKALEKWNAKHGSAYVDTPSNKVQTSKDDSKVISEEEKKRAEMFKSDGNQKLSAGDVNGAIESYSKAIELNPEVAIFYGNRAAAHLKINNFESAVNDARKSIEIDANFTKGYYRLGTALFKLKRNLDALDALEKALDVDSKFGGGAMTSSISALKDEILVSMGKKSAPANNIFGGDSGLESLLSNPMMSQYMNSPAFQQMLQNPQMMGDMLKNLNLGGLNVPSPNNENNASSDSSDFMQQLASNPKLAELKDDPEVAAALEDVKANGMGAAMKYMGNPALMAKIQSALGMGGAFGPK